MKNHIYIIYFLLIVLVLSTTFFGVTSFALQSEVSSLKGQVSSLAKSINDGFDESIYIDDDPILGDENAPVTIVEFSDYQCPFCRKFFNETFNKIVTNYVDTGKVKYVFRDFPLSFHEDAMDAAIAAECVRDQLGDDAYFEFHGKLFSGQNQKGINTVPITDSEIKIYSEELGIDSDEFINCRKDETKEEEVFADLQDGQILGITGTPGFIINGVSISGAQPYAVFERLIERGLK